MVLRGAVDASALLAEVRNRELDREHLDQSVLDVVDKQRTSALPWRGQFTPEFVEALLQTHGKPNGLVIDPFVGSGTVLSEAGRLGLPSLGTEVNPAGLELSKVFELQAVAGDVRRDAMGIAEGEIAAIVMDFGTNESRLPRRMVEAIQRHSGRAASQLLTVALMLAMGNGRHANASSLMKAFGAVRRVVQSMPVAPVACAVSGADARSVPLADGAAEAVITSPPYINVFNYHQNYRPVVELLGWDVLPAARSEIGANRKHRQNRFLTVTQYCIDMAMALIEMARVCKPDAAIVITLGRESRVLDVPFPNGQIIAVLGEAVPELRFERWQERSFMNRFGETIYEDILTFRRASGSLCSEPAQTAEVARDLGRHLLTEAATAWRGRDDVASLIKAAESSASTARPSPRLTLEKLPLAS